MSPFLVQCLYEAQEKADCESALGRSKVDYTDHSSSVFDCSAFGFSIAVSRCTWEEVRLGSYMCGSSLGPEMVEMLMCGLRFQEKVCGSIDSLDLSFNPIGREGMAHLKEMPYRLLQYFFHLHIHYCQLDGTALDLLSEITTTMTSLKDLNIGGNPAVNGGTVNLLQSAATASHLHTLDMGAVPICCKYVISLSHLIRPSGSLKKLTIGDKYMQRDCVELLLKTILSSSSLKHLTLLSMDLTSLPSITEGKL